MTLEIQVLAWDKNMAVLNRLMGPKHSPHVVSLSTSSLAKGYDPLYSS